MVDLSVLIPARSERWLSRTIEDVLEHARLDTEIIVVLDGAWPDEPLPQHPKVTVVFQPVSIGQRAAINLAARLSLAPFLMKLDAHCAVAPGFDAELVRSAAELGEDVIQVPAQYNLHCFDWVCDTCGERTYQGPTPPTCPKCQGVPHHRDVIWQIRKSRLTTSWRFDRKLHFQYWGEYKNRPENQGDIIDVMSCLGACWFVSTTRYWAIGGLDEGHGSWGQMGTEIACKSWLSGGRLVCNKRTWFSHMFRTQGGDFGFPYPISGKQVDKARQYSKQLWIDGGWPQAIRPLSWIIDKFAPVPDWSSPETAESQAQRDRERRNAPDPVAGAPPEAVAPAVRRTRTDAGIVYYTDNRPGLGLLTGVQRQIVKASGDLPIVAVGLKPFVWPEATVLQFPGERGYLTMFRQILMGLEALQTEVVFFCEHDVLYASQGHFTFRPDRPDIYYYNQAVWRVHAGTGQAVTYVTKQTSGLCANRALLVQHYRERIRRVEATGHSYKTGFEPGSHGRPERIDDYGSGVWRSAVPNVDIRHDLSLTPSRWSPAMFRNTRSCRGWTEADAVPGWGVTKGRFAEFFAEHTGVTIDSGVIA